MNLLFGGLIVGQRLPDSDFPVVPPTGLLDDQNILGNNSDLQRRVIELLQDLERKHEYRVLFVLESSLIGTGAQDLAALLQKEWLPNGGGLVVVFESDTGKVGLGRGLETKKGMMNGDMRVPSFSLIEIVSKALEAAKGIEAQEVFLETFITALCIELNDYFELKKAPSENSRSLRLALVTIGALALLALCGMGLGWLIGKSDKERTGARFFPNEQVPERLRAPYGGGGGVCRSFGRRPRH
ncbi:MAG: hypothetical protein AB8D78_10735 [Akkermansiaceae bacterium]